MQKVKVLALVAAVAAVVAAILRKRELAAASEWQSLRPTTPAGQAPTPQGATSQSDAVVERPLPEGYDPLTDPIPPNEL